MKRRFRHLPHPRRGTQIAPLIRDWVKGSDARQTHFREYGEWVFISLAGALERDVEMGNQRLRRVALPPLVVIADVQRSMPP